jgi:folate-binding protein YgfZ
VTGTDGSGTPDPVASAYDALRTGVGVHPLRRDVVRMTGADATSYLQGQCSQDVEALGPGRSADALLLSPQGKVEVYLRVTRVDDNEFVLDTDEGFGSVMVDRLERFRLRVAVAVEPLSWACVAVRGPGATEAVTGSPALVVPAAWPGLTGVDLLGPWPGAGVGAWVAEGAVPCPDEAWEPARIEAGLPVNGRELVVGTIAAEVGLVDRAVSFTKGCFTGQELVARLDARGSNVARRLCGVVIEGPIGRNAPDAPSAALVGAPVWTVDGEHEVGRLSSVAWSPGRRAVVALATLHRRVTPPEAVDVELPAVQGGSRVRAEAVELPFVTAA